ncbi:Crp/Fnr family transcriptional regulator [Variovorax sp. J22G73]|uniref:Crp/Fnr family transcriptional regulator n=1 Tax=unclassified Variovorax TaxID=663243 RepID=UPI0025752DF3|nr:MULTISPECIES: Crp/Fnr family transcriptional regulator [unclassified Variovorax]MDM0010509.1 Crp/Fnr family transcriptional regulator [Variovorax sp. J22R203]MDM0102908.1 Crp/Fnr family transcriptional regulator [Variovorax sp. J22G73]
MYLNPIFASVPQEEREALVRSSELRSYRRNEVVLAARSSTDCIYCVSSGLLRVVGHGGGRAQPIDVTTDFIRQDEFFIGPSLAEDTVQSRQTLVAALPSSVHLIPIAAFRRLCELYPDVATGLLDLAIKRMALMRNQLRRMSALSTGDVVSRVLHKLTVLAPASTGAFDKRISQSVIASYAGLSREVVNKTMRDMEQRGLVRRDDQGVHVPAEFASTDFGSLLPVERSLAQVAPNQLDPVYLRRALPPAANSRGRKL